MRISLIAAVADNGVIGAMNGLPWHLPADLKRFRKLTTGKPVIMGRKTWEAIGRPLPDRKNIVITHDEDYTAEGAVVVGSIVEALAEAGESNEVMVIGGEDVYRQMLPHADRMYLTYVHTTAHGDARFPEFDQNEWSTHARKEHAADQDHEFGFTMVRLDRAARPTSGGRGG